MKKNNKKKAQPNFWFKFPFGGYDTKENVYRRIILEIIVLATYFAIFWLGLLIGKDL